VQRVDGVFEGDGVSTPRRAQAAHQATGRISVAIFS
jgi:hypothetical protein